MTLRYIALTIAIGCLCSCSSAKKAQTTDNVYYSDGSQDAGGGYVANDGSDDRIQPASTADNYNQYAYNGDDNAYSPYNTFIDPYWGSGFGMSPYFGGGFGFGFGLYSGLYGYSPFSPWRNYYGFGYGYPSYYGGFYNPYYPGFGYYYGHAAVASASPGFTSLYTGGANRVNVLAYNNRHFNNVTTTVAPQAIGRPVNGTISGRVATSIASNKVTTNGWQTNRVDGSNNRLGQTNRQVTTRTTNQQPVRTQQRTFQQQPTYRPMSTGGSRGGFGGGGGRVGGGGFGRGH